MIPAPSISAHEMAYAELLFELDTNTVLYEYNKDEALPVGVLNKLMTVLVASEAVEEGKISLSDIGVAPSDSKIKGASVWLEPGDEITVDELFRGVIIGNANDAAVTLISAVTDDVNDYTNRYEDLKSSLLLTSTNFTNEHGFLEPENQLSSAYDLSKIVTALSKYDFLSDYFKQKLDYIRDGKAQLVSSNKLLQSDEALGYKSGYAGASGYCLAGAKERDGARYGVILLGFSDEDEMYERAKVLLESGFNNYASIVPEIPEKLPESVAVKGSLHASVPISVLTPEKIIVKTEDTGKLESTVFLPDYIYAPVKKGDRVGEIHYYLNGKVIYKLTLHASSDISKLNCGNIFAILTEMLYSFGNIL
jgi:D-alanyl-D-alanine carboxypeptidase (penicillin-binding protein 5/6)